MEAMPLDMKPFVKFIKLKDAKRAREWLEVNKAALDLSDESSWGYLLALQGMVSALETGGELSALSKILEKKYTQEQMAELMKEAKSKASQKFRTKDEQGFNAAWMDFLNELTGEKTA